MRYGREAENISAWMRLGVRSLGVRRLGVRPRMRLRRANVHVRALCAGYDEVPSSVMLAVARRKTTADCTDTCESIRQSDRCVVSPGCCGNGRRRGSG